jgi:hypothetical protein
LGDIYFNSTAKHPDHQLVPSFDGTVGKRTHEQRRVFGSTRNLTPADAIALTLSAASETRKRCDRFDVAGLPTASQMLDVPR